MDPPGVQSKGPPLTTTFCFTALGQCTLCQVLLPLPLPVKLWLRLALPLPLPLPLPLRPPLNVL
jgi:hypothetical protein